MTLLGQMLMEDGFKKGREQGIEQGIEQGYIALIQTCKEIGLDFEETREKARKGFNISDAEAEKCLNQYWD